VFGKQRRVVLTHSPTLHEGQSRGLDQTLTKVEAQLAELIHNGHKVERFSMPTAATSPKAKCRVRCGNDAASRIQRGHDSQIMIFV
jgi:hypothetical protein